MLMFQVVIFEEWRERLGKREKKLNKSKEREREKERGENPK